MNRALVRSVAFLSLLMFAGAVQAAELTLQNDGFMSGQSAGFQGGFITGESGASRFIAPGPFPMQVKKIQLLFGGNTATETVTLNIYDDSAGSVAPGAVLFTGDYSLTGSSTALSEIDITADNVFVNDDFRVGIEFQHDGFPSIARDDDGSITPALNFIDASGFGWIQSNLLGVTGDWVIRAIVEDATPGTFTVGGNVSGLSGSLTLQNNGGDDIVINADGPFVFPTALSDGAGYNVTVLSEPAGQDCVVSFGSGTISAANVSNVAVACSNVGGGPEELANDSFMTGQSVAFQAGFAAGEIAASRFTPSGPSDLRKVRFLFGGAAATVSVKLRVWDDTGSLVPGTELFMQDYLVTASNTDLQEIDLIAEGITVSGPFRVGLEFSSPGLPSIAADTDGNIDANANLIFSGVWNLSQTLGVSGDWILRAEVQALGAAEPEILSIADVGNDQGRQVRIEFARSSQDQAGASTPILNYEAYRRNDPLPGQKRLDGWDFVGSVPAHGDDIYSFIAPTLADSTVAQGIHWSAFLIRAATAVPTTFFESVPDSGYSVDNLAPAPPANLVFGGGQLAWDPSPETDFDYYQIYGSNTGLLDGSESALGSTSANSFDPNGGPYGFYLVTAVDYSGNEGLAAVIEDLVTAVDDLPNVPRETQVYPNPFNPGTSIRLRLLEPTSVTIGVYDVRGRKVESLVENAPMGAGDHTIAYRTQLPSGSYFLRVLAGDRVETLKMTVLQ